MNDKPSPAEIQRWFPQAWPEIAGNSQVVKTFKNFIMNGACSFLLTGPSRSGKTRVSSLLIKALCCPNRTMDLSPCNACDTCKDVANARWAHAGVFRNWNSSHCSFLTIDCQTAQREDLLNIRDAIDLESQETIVYLDEVAALRQGNRDELLLKIMDESEASWCASAVKLQKPEKEGPTGTVRGISEQLLKRFPLKLGTAVPRGPELITWIQDRCNDWSIDVVEPDVTLKTVVEKSGNVVGKVLHFLTVAATNNRRLDNDLVKELSLESLD
jgi:hypothetical protein